MNNISPFISLTKGNLNLGRATSHIELNGEIYPIEWQMTDTANTWQAITPAGEFFLRVEKLANGVRFLPSVKLSATPESMHFCLLNLPALQIDHFYGCGKRMGKHKNHLLPVSNLISGVVYYHAVLTLKEVTAMVSAPLNQTSDNFIEYLLTEHMMQNFQFIYEVRYNDRTQWEFDPVTVSFGDGLKLIEQYADENIETKKQFSEKSEYGWNSWDYYRWTINEDEVIKNAEFIAKDPVLSKYIKRIIVDDGWQYCYGEWEANCYFPSGMKKLAERLLKMNFTPGLWFAPGIVEPHTYIAQMDYQMLACSEGGQPCLSFECMERHGFVLDPTVPQTRQWLTKLFDRYASMGYGYFKLDFLEPVLNAPRFADRSVPRCRILPMMMQAISEGVAGRSSLLGCNYAFSNGNRQVESVRVGDDIHPRWDCIKRNVIPVAASFWTNRKLWWNDPDFAVCRCAETSSDPDLNRLSPMLIAIQANSPFIEEHNYQMATATLDEVKVLLSISLMAAGTINLSDNLPLLNAVGVDLLRRVVSASPGETGIPLDLLSSELPTYWIQHLFNGNTRLLLINWQDIPAVIPLDWRKLGAQPTQARDFWTDEVVSVSSAIELQPHSCKLIEF